MRSRSSIVILALAGGLSLAACGSSGKSSSATTSPPAATTAPSATSPSATSPSATSAASGSQHLTVTPSTGLKSPATVQVKATGFSPNEALVVTQCANKGNSTGPGDCNLAGVQMVTANSAGQVQTQMSVIKGPFGANHIVCSSTQTCLVSVTPVSASPNQEADAPISFG
jgi:hypothetical protein